MDKKPLGMNQPILITGCARSGTSMTAGIFDMAGAFGGITAGPNHYNRKGMFENNGIRGGIVKPFFRHVEADPMGQHPLPDIDLVKLVSKRAVINWRLSVQKVLVTQGYRDNQTWYYKGAKMVLIWPMWQRAYPEAYWIVVRRDSDAIVNSCMKTSFMRAHKHELGWMKWVDHHKEQFINMESAGMNIRYVWPQKMINRDYTEIKDVLDWVGLSIETPKLEDFIEPCLWSSR